MNVTLLTGGSQITQDSSIFDRLQLGGSTLLLGMVIVFAVLGIIFIALQIMRAIFTKRLQCKTQSPSGCFPLILTEKPVGYYDLPRQ